MESLNLFYKENDVLKHYNKKHSSNFNEPTITEITIKAILKFKNDG